MKKIISALLLIVMVLGTVPAYATSANTNAEPQRHYLGDGSYYVDTLTVKYLVKMSAQSQIL